jgi:predicted GNAT family N-acyltransferase
VDLIACIAIVRNGNAVDPDSAAAEVRHAKLLAVARREDSIVGVGAIKRVRNSYTAAVANRSGATLESDTPELGYVAVDGQHRGHDLSHHIVAELLSKYRGRLFATTSSDRMKVTLAKAGFIQMGCEWDGHSGQLSLWTRE